MCEGFCQPVQRQRRLGLLVLRMLHEGQRDFLAAEGQDSRRTCGGGFVVPVRVDRRRKDGSLFGGCLRGRCLPGSRDLVIVQVFVVGP